MPRITVGSLNAIETVRHAFFTRLGGVSAGVYASNNCGFGSKDKPDAVAENRARAAARLEVAPDRIVTVYQTHSADVVEVETPWRRQDSPRADALVTRRPGIGLGILTADCAPVLFADPEARVIGAAHAGWRGALAGVLEATVGAMVKLGAATDRIVVTIGPAIAQRSYEVGPEFPAPFLAADATNATFFSSSVNHGRWMFDLKAYVASRLGNAGLRHVGIMPNDTCGEPERFFSYRRSCLRGEPDYGRMLSAIVLD